MSFLLSSAFLVLVFAAGGIMAGLVQRALGLISVAHGAVLGVGAYIYALTTKAGAGVGIGFLASMLSGVGTGWLLGMIAERARGEAFVLITFGIQILWLGLIGNLEVLGGPLGIAGIPAVDVALLSFMTMVGTLAAVLAHWRLRGTALGAAYSVLARGTELARALALPVRGLLALLLTAYGSLVALAGAFFAAHLGFIDPTLFGIAASVSILAVGFFAAARGPLSGLLGSLVIVGLPQVLRLIGLSGATAGYLQTAFAGVALFGATLLWFRGQKP